MANEVRKTNSAVRRPSPEGSNTGTGYVGLGADNIPTLAAADASVGSQGSGIETLDLPSRARRRMVGDKNRPPTAG